MLSIVSKLFPCNSKSFLNFSWSSSRLLITLFLTKRTGKGYSPKSENRRDIHCHRPLATQTVIFKAKYECVKLALALTGTVSEVRS